MAHYNIQGKHGSYVLGSENVLVEQIYLTFFVNCD